MVRKVQVGPLFGLVAQLVLLAVLAATVGLGLFGALAGIAVGAATNAALVLDLERRGQDALGPADRVTLARATLVGGVAALAADSLVVSTQVTTGLSARASTPVMVALATIALVLDAVDGWVARRTATCSALGARFDMEVDAFLILVLSVYLAPSLGGWVLAIGVARYAFVVAGMLLPWLRGSLPPRYWRKVVAAIQGIVLTAAVAQVLPHPMMTAVLLISLALLTESFGRDVAGLGRGRRARSSAVTVPGPVVDVRAFVELPQRG
jgi:phosphatidylglycerophosphate synthase